MSLIENMMEPFAYMDKRRQPDGEGGYIVTWIQSNDTFQAIAKHDTTITARVAEKDGMKSTYDLYTAKTIPLDYGTVVKRLSDGVTFRITSEPEDRRTPAGSDMDLQICTAERWDLT